MNCAFFLVDSDDSEDLSFSGFHGSVDGSAHGGGVLVDGQHTDLSVVLEEGDVASVLFGFDGLSLSVFTLTMTSSPSAGNSLR